MRVGDRLALFVGNQHAVAAAGDLALVRRIGMEQPVHDRGAARVGEQLALIADQARGSARRTPAATRPPPDGLHLDQLGLALGHLLHDDAGMLLVDVDHDLLDRLFQLAGGVAAEQHLGARHRQLEALAAHGLDQDAELQFAAAGHFHRVLVVGFADAQRDVALGLAQQAVADHAAGDLVALGAGERRIVDAERHRQGRRIDRLRVDRRLDRRDRRWCGRRSPPAGRRWRRCRRRPPLRPERARARGRPAPW